MSRARQCPALLPSSFSTDSPQQTRRIRRGIEITRTARRVKHSAFFNPVILYHDFLSRRPYSSHIHIYTPMLAEPATPPLSLPSHILVHGIRAIADLNTMNPSVDIQAINYTLMDLQTDIAQTCTQLFLYGIYIHFFLSAIHNLWRRKITSRRPLLFSIWVMLLLGTTQVVLQLVLVVTSFRIVQQTVHPGINATVAQKLATSYDTLDTVTDIVLAINNLFTDIFLLYRCYLIWNSQFAVIILPGLLIMAVFLTTTIKGVHTTFFSDFEATYILAAITNIIITGLTAGHIWWMTREVSHIKLDGGNIIRKRYTRAVRIILESGALYCICVLTSAIAAPHTNTDTNTPAVWIATFADAVSMQAVNIIPTLALVLGTREVESNGDRPEDMVELLVRPNSTALRKAAVKAGPASNPPRMLSKVIYVAAETEDSENV
ncbi:hypothetical protein FB45DRAFT_181621 [Roridomyces roridus]|uniref:Uncharacterized protein n=1 Tax=Roridomyces roridus TaxID=1738132 RepID=A0AAD7FW34_9AGAR|nr:hypothetical protein FB45DRAFT_181621 [Roridomyces roridus]